MFSLPPSTCSYEESLVRGAQRGAVDRQRVALFPGCADFSASECFSRRAQTRLASTQLVPTHHVSGRGKGGGSLLARLRSEPDGVLFLQPCQFVRSLRAVLRDSAICSRVGTRVTLQDSRLRLVDEAFRERSCTGRAPPVGPEAHVAPDAGSDRLRDELGHFSRGQADA